MRMDQHSWKGNWWDWVWMKTGRSEFTVSKGGDGISEAGVGAGE